MIWTLPTWPQVARSNRTRAQPSIPRSRKATGRNPGAARLQPRADFGRTVLQRVVLTLGQVRRRQAVAAPVEVEDATFQRHAALDDGVRDGATCLCVEGGVAGRAQGFHVHGPALSVYVPTQDGPGPTTRRRPLADPVVGVADGARRAAAATIPAAVGVWASQARGDGVAERTTRTGDGEVSQQVVPTRFGHGLGDVADCQAAVAARPACEAPGGKGGLFLIGGFSPE